MMPADESEAYARRSDVDGFTIVPRKGRRPRIHLLRPWNECNTEQGKAGPDVQRVEGSRELLAEKLEALGYKRGGVPCLRCFPAPTAEEEAAAYVEAPAYDPKEDL